MKINGIDEEGKPILTLEDHELEALRQANDGKEPTEEQITKYIEKVFGEEIAKELGVNEDE